MSRLAYQCALREGIDIADLVEQAGLTKEIIEDAKTQIGVADQIKFVELVADALGDKNFGFHLAFDHDVREIGLFYYVAASADTLGTALRRMERYSAIQNEGIRIKVTKGNAVRLSFVYSGVARHTDVQQIEFIIGSMIRTLRHLTGRSLAPARVRVMHRIGRDKAELQRLLDCTIEDGFDVDRLELPAPSWELPIVSADPHLHRLCVQNCEEALARRNKNASPLKSEVENTIAALLPHGPARHDVVAAKLGMSPRTLARRLSSEGSSFAVILEEVRAALAQRYLADRSLPISQIAWLLGYAEIGTFTRAYQRWAGIPPSAARARQEALTAAATMAAGAK